MWMTIYNIYLDSIRIYPFDNISIFVYRTVLLDINTEFMLVYSWKYYNSIISYTLVILWGYSHYLLFV